MTFFQPSHFNASSLSRTSRLVLLLLSCVQLAALSGPDISFLSGTTGRSHVLRRPIGIVAVVFFCSPRNKQIKGSSEQSENRPLKSKPDLSGLFFLQYAAAGSIRNQDVDVSSGAGRNHRSGKVWPEARAGCRSTVPTKSERTVARQCRNDPGDTVHLAQPVL